MSLLDDVKRGAFGLLTGPGDPRVPAQETRRAGLTRAGLGIAAAAEEGMSPLGSIAMGALAGQEAAAEAEQAYLRRQSQMALREMVEAGGYNYQSLTRAFFQTLAAGDVDGARSIGQIIQSLPNPQAAPNANISYQTIGDRRVKIVSDPKTGETMSTVDLGPAPDTNVYERLFQRDVDGRTHNIGIVRGTGQEVDLGPAPASGGGAGDPNAAVSGAILQDLDTAFDPRLADMDTALLVRLSEPGNSPSVIRGFIGDLANRGLGDIQPAAAAAARVGGMVQRVMSGAQMSNQERQFYRSAFTIRGGDNADPRTIPQKKQAVRMIAERLGVTSLDQADARVAELESTPEGRAELRAIMQDAARSIGLQPPAEGSEPTPGNRTGLFPPRNR